MGIEVVDNTAPEGEHKCTPGEACDVHRAKRWIAKLKEGNFPDEDLEAFYLLLLSQCRIAAAVGNTIDLYQGALTALTRRAGGMIVIASDEMVPDGRILNPDVDPKTEAVSFRLSSLEEMTKEIKATIDKAAALEEVRNEDAAPAKGFRS
jgi:hypothetical protein